MLEKPSDRHTRELQDPMLSALLRDALADDPALEESPGRTDRIMRKVLASGVRPARRATWAPFAWAGGAFATAAAAVALVFMTAQLPGPLPNVANGVPQPPKQTALRDTPAETVKPFALPETPSVTNKPTPTVNEKPNTWANTQSTISRQPEQVDTPRHIDKPNAAPSAESSTQIAAALYEAGNVAKSLGDYESAYHAYQASYEALPTPAALLASSSALEEMAELALSMDDLSS